MPLLATVLFGMLLILPQARAGDDVSDQLKADYQGKVLTLRHFYKGNHLVFRGDGSLSGFAEVGPWTVDGQIFVQTIEVRGRELQIRGRRICLVFDSKKGPPRDVLEWLAESKADDRDKREGAFWAKDVDIEIDLDSENPDFDRVEAAMNPVFLAPGESIRDIVPDFWRDYFDQADGPRNDGDSEGVFLVRTGEVSAPRQISGWEPEFSDEARIAKYQGTMTMSVVVDPSGTARDVAIVTPLGLGLDENAIERVKSWKFSPGMKDGSPVSVKVTVEMDFHLY